MQKNHRELIDLINDIDQFMGSLHRDFIWFLDRTTEDRLEDLIEGHYPEMIKYIPTDCAELLYSIRALRDIIKNG